MKTTEITISYTIQKIINNPDIRIFITNERLNNAQSFLREIKTHFEKNDKLRYLYGDFVDKELKWTDTEIIVSKRKKVLKEPTIQCGSVDISLVSQHYDLIIGDDLVSRTNITTKEQMDKVKQYWKDLLSLLEPGGMVVDVGTRWHFDDLHGQLLKDDTYSRFIRECWDINRTPLFPEKWTIDSLTAKLKEIGSYDFSCLYLNNPVDDENADFKRSYFENRYQESDLHNKPTNCFITIDNAPSTKKGTDFQGIIVNKVDKDNFWYLPHVERFKGNSPALIDKIFELWNYYHPLVIGIEQKAYEDLIKPYFDLECRKRNQFPNVIELKDKGIRKEDRIRGRLQGRFESKSIFLQANPEDNTNDLIDEGVRFPKGQYDDLLDALQYQDEIAYKPEPDIQETDYSIYGKQDYT